MSHQENLLLCISTITLSRNGACELILGVMFVYAALLCTQ